MFDTQKRPRGLTPKRGQEKEASENPEQPLYSVDDMGKYRSHSHLASSKPLQNTTESLSLISSCTASCSTPSSTDCGRAHPIESHGDTLPGVHLDKGKEEEVPHVALLSASWPTCAADMVIVCLCNKVIE